MFSLANSPSPREIVFYCSTAIRNNVPGIRSRIDFFFPSFVLFNGNKTNNLPPLRTRQFL